MRGFNRICCHFSFFAAALLRIMKLTKSLILNESYCKIVGIPVIKEPLTCPETRKTPALANIANSIHCSFPANRIKNSRY